MNEGRAKRTTFNVYASIPANNLWYYPLDGAPAIIDAELGVGDAELGVGGEQAYPYLDLTFSAPVDVSLQDEDGVGVFDDAIHLAGMSISIQARPRLLPPH